MIISAHLGMVLIGLNNIIRDIEGLLIMNSINMNNPFHEMSYFIKSFG